MNGWGASNNSNWVCSGGNYAASTGAYTGTVTTTVDGASVRGEWINLRVTTPFFNLSSYTLRSNGSGQTTAPTSWIVAGSRDGIAYTTLHSVASGNISTAVNTFSITSLNSSEWLHLRIIITNVSTANAQAVDPILSGMTFNAITSAAQTICTQWLAKWNTLQTQILGGIQLFGGQQQWTATGTCTFTATGTGFLQFYVARSNLPAAAGFSTVTGPGSFGGYGYQNVAGQHTMCGPGTVGTQISSENTANPYLVVFDTTSTNSSKYSVVSGATASGTTDVVSFMCVEYVKVTYV